MRPFTVCEPCRELTDLFPSSVQLAAVARRVEASDRRSIVQLWFSEGIPFAFHPLPMLYEAIRSWLAPRLQVHAKQITVVGSARLGYSLGAMPNYGREFGLHSDLDIAVISNELFGRLSEEFRRWIGDFKEGAVRTRNDRERGYWVDNSNRVPRNLGKGFIDANRIPTFNRYPTAQSVEQAMFELKGKLKETPGAPQFKHSSVRCYRDWQSFVTQLAVNFDYALESIA